MPTVDFNKQLWDGKYNWSAQGDDWSRAWGTPSMQWHGSLLPRISKFVPAGTILEIACGYGRWTHYLKSLCEKLVLVDLSKECIDACKQRFSASSHIEYHVNDGMSLSMAPDASVDFVFSYDSLVHVDETVMRAYIRELGRILKPGAAAFLHHSNLGEYRNAFHQTFYRNGRPIWGIGDALAGLGVLDKKLHMRDWSVDATKIRGLAEEFGMRCASQEIIPWVKGRMLIDCMSTIVKDGGSHDANRILRNQKFNSEIQNLRRLSEVYAD